MADPFVLIDPTFDQPGVGPPPFQYQQRGWNPCSRAWAIWVKDDWQTLQKRFKKNYKNALCDHVNLTHPYSHGVGFFIL